MRSKVPEISAPIISIDSILFNTLSTSIPIERMSFSFKILFISVNFKPCILLLIFFCFLSSGIGIYKIKISSFVYYEKH